jgi:hypothetical protein
MRYEPTIKILMRSVGTTAGVALCFWMAVGTQMAFSQAAAQQEVSDSVPKAPDNDFTVQVFKALDEKKADRLTFKEKYKQDKTEIEVELVISYYNWSINDSDYWNRQINIETKTKEGDVIEKIVKSGFGELGYVKKGDAKTQDVFKKEKVTGTGDAARAVMVDMEIGEKEKQRYRSILEKHVLAK